MEGFGALVLLSGIGLLILSTSTRFIHITTSLLSKSNDQSDDLRLQQRGRLLHRALVALYFTLALIVASAALIQIIGEQSAGAKWASKGLFLAAIVNLFGASLWLVRESFLARKVIDAVALIQPTAQTPDYDLNQREK